MRAISLLSGGLDSIVATWAAAQEHTIVAAITCDYGQRARDREIEAARNVAGKLRCEHIVVDISWLGALGGNALTSEGTKLPTPAEQELDDSRAARRTAAAVWVPNRNGVMVNVAGAHADAMNCEAIICGFNAEEAATFPDNSPDFITAADRFLELSTKAHPRILSPTAELTKPQIVDMARETGAPISDVYSCYRGGHEHCWHCESCRRLKRALERAGAWEHWRSGRPG